MLAWFSRRTFRNAPAMTFWLVVSLVVSTAILLYATSKNGTFLGCFTDHLHHARATWHFFHLGPEVYKISHGEACTRVAYPQAGCTWERWPVAYPPGMFLVFTPPALFGQYVLVPEIVFSKIMIGYITLITHGALWGIAVIARRRGTPLVMAAVAFVWIICVRNALLGFYEGAWLLTGALAVDAMTRSRHARALAWFVASALISYRAVCFVPLAAVALWQMLRGPDAPRTKALTLAFAGAASVIVLWCAWAGTHYGPHQMMEASPLLAMGPDTWSVLVVGAVVAVFLGYGVSLLMGVTVVTSTALAVAHGGDAWHATVCAAPLLAFVIAPRRPLWTQVVFCLWLVFYIQKGFWTPPLLWLDEILRLIRLHGGPSC